MVKTVSARSLVLQSITRAALLFPDEVDAVPAPAPQGHIDALKSPPAPSSTAASSEDGHTVEHEPPTEAKAPQVEDDAAHRASDTALRTSAPAAPSEPVSDVVVTIQPVTETPTAVVDDCSKHQALAMTEERLEQERREKELMVEWHEFHGTTENLLKRFAYGRTAIKEVRDILPAPEHVGKWYEVKGLTPEEDDVLKEKKLLGTFQSSSSPSVYNHAHYSMEFCEDKWILKEGPSVLYALDGKRSSPPRGRWSRVGAPPCGTQLPDGIAVAPVEVSVKVKGKETKTKEVIEMTYNEIEEFEARQQEWISHRSAACHRVAGLHKALQMFSTKIHKKHGAGSSEDAMHKWRREDWKADVEAIRRNCALLRDSVDQMRAVGSAAGGQSDTVVAMRTVLLAGARSQMRQHEALKQNLEKNAEEKFAEQAKIFKAKFSVDELVSQVNSLQILLDNLTSEKNELSLDLQRMSATLDKLKTTMTQDKEQATTELREIASKAKDDKKKLEEKLKARVASLEDETSQSFAMEQKRNKLEQMISESSPVKAGVHYIFLLDQSGTMGGQKWQVLKNSMRQFIDVRKAGQSDDLCSIVCFDCDAQTIVAGKQILSTPSNILDLHKFRGGGTSYRSAFAAAKHLATKHYDRSRKTMTIFMTDGASHDTADDIAKSMYDSITNQEGSLPMQTFVVAFELGASGGGGGFFSGMFGSGYSNEGIVKKLESLTKAANGDRTCMDIGGEKVDFLMHADVSTLLSKFQQISSLESLQTAKLKASLDQTKRILMEAKQEAEQERRRAQTELESSEKFSKEMEEKATTRAKVSAQEVQSMLADHRKVVEGESITAQDRCDKIVTRIQQVALDLSKKQSELGGAQAKLGETRKDVEGNMNLLNDNRKRMMGQQKNAQELQELFAQNIGVTKLADILNGVDTYGEARFQQRQALQKDEMMLERLAEYGDSIASGIDDPVVSEFTANAYPLQIAKYFKVNKGISSVVGNAGRFFEDFQAIASHLMKDLRDLELSKQEESLLWIDSVCPAGLATLWDACLSKMLREPVYEKQQKIKGKMLDLLQEHIHKTPAGEKARKIAVKISTLRRKRTKINEKIEAKEEKLEDAERDEERELEETIKALNEDLKVIEDSLEELQEQLLAASRSFQYAIDVFDNILVRLFKVTVEVEVQLHIGNVIQNVCGPVFTQLIPDMVSFRTSQNELEKLLLNTPAAAIVDNAEEVMAALPGGLTEKMSRLKQLGDGDAELSKVIEVD